MVTYKNNKDRKGSMIFKSYNNNMIDKFIAISIMNEATIKLLKDKKDNYEQNLKIKEYLKDEAFFFKINKEEAFKILESIGIKKENIKSTYEDLISPNKFYELINKGKINSNDNNLQIKYKLYNSNELFKKRKK